MLKREKLAKAIEVLSHRLFQDLSGNNNQGEKLWKNLVADQEYLQKVQLSKGLVGLPRWRGALDELTPVTDQINQYAVLAVDGSQIYPDRHIAGVGCFLVNAGGCLLSYSSESFARFFSEPCLLVPEDVVPEGSDLSFSVDLVDLKREEFELEIAFRNASDASKKHEQFITLFDGSIIFWHLEGKPQEVREHFLQQYLFYLHHFYEHKILNAGYISLSKSKELVQLIRVQLCRSKPEEFVSCQGKSEGCPCRVTDDVYDTNILKNVLKPFYRTTIFFNQSKITEYYPQYLKPCFFYLDVGKEIVRIEIPAWVAREPTWVNLICMVSIDQARKGFGYPVALAEAHEQAVIKGPDREFFYHLIRKIGIERQLPVFASQKSIKKRGMGI